MPRNLSKAFLLVLAATACVGAQLSAQMSGTYTVANGNPNGVFDYGDLGSAFDDLEANGVSGPVTIEVYDDGGAFTSATNYVLDAVTGASATNTITITAPGSERPVVSGAGAFVNNFTGLDCTLAIYDAPYVTLDGLELENGVDCGLLVYQNGAATNVTISRCRVHGVTIGHGIGFYGSVGTTLANFTIENNFIWDCAGQSTPLSGYLIGALAIRRAVATTIIRHNTIVHNNGGTGSCAFGDTGGGGATNTYVFENNIITCSTNAEPVLNIVTGSDPVNADYNIYYESGGAIFHSDTGTYPNGFTDWQTAGFDANGQDADPMLQNVSVGTEDLHLQSGSGAVNAATGTAVSVDIENESRPAGAASDIGADEDTAAAAPTITSTAGTTAIQGALYTYFIHVLNNGSTTTLSLGTGAPLWLNLAGNVLYGTPGSGDAGVNGPFDLIATNSTGTDTESITINVTGNLAPTISVTENSNAVAADQVITTTSGASISSLALSFVAQDANGGDTVTFTTTVSPSANITTFTQSEWDQTTPGNPTTAAMPSSGTITTDGLITVVITATDSNSASTTFRFFILVPITGGNTAPTVNLATGSAFTGNATSGFSYSGTVGTPLANATLDLFDADADAIDVLTESGTAAGITLPGT
ncbi:MAG: hypothetical protein KDB82_15490, partial [Planctomycetes bacterium]|nr:hypothetical protein [Planctomycetota bacterium]